MSDLKPFMRLVKEFRDNARMMYLFDLKARRIFIACANRLEAEIQTYNARPAPDVDALARDYAKTALNYYSWEGFIHLFKQFAAELMGE